MSPLGIQSGKKATLTFTGKNLLGATNLWTSFPATIRPLTNSNAQSVSFEVITDDLAPGVQWVQLGSTNGASEYRSILIDSVEARSVNQESAHSATNAVFLTIPQAIDAVLDHEQSDFYSFEAKAGDSIAIEAIAQRIASRMDPVVSVQNKEGEELVSCDDEGGIWRDSRFQFSVPGSGRYFIAVHDVGFDGGSEFFYRLRVTRDPLIWFTFPLVDPGEFTAPFEMIGLEVPTPVREGSPANPSAIPVISTTAAVAEREPNDEPANAQQVPNPIRLHGKLEKPDDIDFLSFAAEKGDKLVFQSRTRSLGSPCDLRLTLLSNEGSQVAESNGTDPSDAALTNTIQKDGRYFLKVRELSGGAAPGVPYRIDIHPFVPGVAASVESIHVQVAPGKEATISVNLARLEFTGPVTLSFDKPVEGLTIKDGIIPEQKDKADIKIQAASTLAPGSLLHVRLKASSGTNNGRLVSTEPALEKTFPLMPNHPPALDGLISVSILSESKPPNP